MKNKRWIAFPIIVLILALAACGNGAEEVEAMEEEQIPEISASDLLVDSLEYLLDEDSALSEAESFEEEPEEETDSKEMPIEENELVLQEETPDEEEIPQVEVTIYYGNGASNELKAEISTMEQVSAENLIDALIRQNIVSLGTKVHSFEEKDENGEKMLYLDLSKTFREYLKTMTQEGENIIMSSVTTTFLEAYGADKIVITIDGDVLETEYGTYSEPLHCAPGELLENE